MSTSLKIYIDIGILFKTSKLLLGKVCKPPNPEAYHKLFSQLPVFPHVIPSAWNALLCQGLGTIHSVQ